jgi:lipase maturation factor 1
MDWAPRSAIGWFFDSEQGLSNRLMPRWLVLRCLGGIYFSAFLSLVFQIRGLIGPEGILPAGEYLQNVARSLGYARFWFAPTLLWISSGPRMLTGLCWVGMIASLLLLFNVWPRGALVICFVCFLSFVSAAEDFSGYQSDGMLLEAGFISLFFAPPGFRPGLGAARPPSRASLFLLQWEWFRIYFESGIAKIASGDPEWRQFTAMDEYYQNGPLPTWVGWYVQHLPHWFHASTTVATLVLELIFVWMMFLPRRLRIVCFLIVTPWEAGVILTANYTFLNYLVLALGFLLLDDKFLLQILPERCKRAFLDQTRRQQRHPEPAQNEFAEADRGKQGAGLKTVLKTLPLSLSALMLSWIFYATTVQMIWMLIRLSLPTSPVTVLEPFRIANRYGLFAVMTRGRYEIEFQGSQDGEHWVAYPFRYKPQDTSKPPGIYAPYQPRFDWNLWFASLGSWRENAIVPSTEERLLSNAPEVLELFAGHPFPNQPPRLIRAVLWQYWFTTMSERRAQGQWWRRQWLGLYAPTLEREADGKIAVVEWPTVAPRQ